MATEFHGADLVTLFRSNPANVAVDHYVVSYQCATGTVVHRVDQADFQSQGSDGTRSYQDTLSFSENMGAGLTRTPTVTLQTVLAGGAASTGDKEFAQNSIPVLPSAPQVTGTFDGVQVKLQTPGDGDLAGYVAWVDNSTSVAMDDAHQRYRGGANSFAIPLADDSTYYLRVAPYDAFGLDLASAWAAIPIKRGAAASSLASATAAYNQLQNVTIPAVQQQAAQDKATLQAAVAQANSDLAATRTTLQAADAAIRQDVSAAQTQAATDRQTAAQTAATLKTQADADRAAAASAAGVAKAQADAARADASTIAGNLSTEIARAQGAEGTISTSITNLTQTVAGNTSSISSEATQRVTADASLSSRIDQVTSGYQNADSALNASISTVNTTLTNSQAALAARTTSIESTYARGQFLNGNPDYLKPWTSGFAPDWQDWLNGLTFGQRAVVNGRQAVSFNVDGNSSGWQSVSGTTGGGWYVLEAVVRHDGGGWTGAGIHAHLYDTSGVATGQQNNLTFSSDPDSNGNVYGQGGVGRTFSFSKLVNYPAGALDGSPFFRFYTMANWDGLGSLAAKSITFLHAGIRQASDAEVQAGRATGPLVAVNARVDSESSARASADGALSSRIDNISASSGDAGAAIQNEATARANADGALSSRLDSVQSSYQNADGALQASINSEATTRASADGSISSRIDAVISSYQAADAAQANATMAAITSEQTTRANADGALSTRIDQVFATANGNTAAISSESTARTTADGAFGTRIDSLTTTVGGNTAAINNEATARSTADAALATRTSSLETTYGSQGGSLNANPNYSLWPDGQTFPTGWSWWQPADSIERVASPYATGGFMARVVSNHPNSGLAQQGTSGQPPVYITVGWYVMEADVELLAGDWTGSGLTIQGQYNLDFSAEPDSNGSTRATGLGRRLFSKLVQVGANLVNWHQMENWDGFGRGWSSKTVQWHRSSIRQASDAEIQAGRATPAIASAVARIATEETTRSNGDGALSTRIDQVTAAYQAGDNATSAQVSNEASTRSAADGSLSDRILAVQAGYQNANTSTNARIGTEENARATGDASLGSRIDQVSAGYQANDQTLSTAITNESSARASADGALAVRASNLESTSNSAASNSINRNPTMQAWPDGQQFPTYWQDWVNGGRGIRQAGQAPGSWNIMFTAPANDETGIVQNGLYFGDGWYVLEADVFCAGSWMGSGVSIGGRYNLDFARDPDTNGATGARVANRRKFSKIMQMGAYDGAPIHQMANWSGFGQRDAKTIYFDRCLIRSASDAEIKAQRAFTTDIPNAVARIATEETTRANNDGALSGRIDTVTASYQNADSNIVSVITNETTARANADGALSGRIDSLSSTVGSNSGAISSEATTRANNDGALSGRIDQVTATSNGNVSSIQSEQSARVSADVALSGRIDSLSTTVGQNTSAITTESQTRASADAAQASRTSTLEAGVATYLNRNPLFGVVGYVAAPGQNIPPSGWNMWSVDGGSTTYARSDYPNRSGTPGVCTFRSGGQHSGIFQTVSNIPAGWYVIEAEVEKPYGNWNSAGVFMQRQSDGVTIGTISFGGDPDINGMSYPADGYNRRSWSKLVQTSVQTSFNLYAMGGWSGFYGGVDNSADIIWHQCSVRPASNAEIAAQKVSDANLIARVTTNESSISGINGKVAAYWQTTAVAGNNRAQLTIHADANGGAGVDIVGDVGISGNLLVGGTVTTTRLRDNAVTNGAFVQNDNTYTGQGGVSAGTSSYSVG